MVCGQVTSFCQTINPIIILVHIEIIMILVHIKKAIGTQDVGMIYLKMKTDGMHNKEICGAGGSRTRVQTCCKDAFYMFSLSLIVGEGKVLGTLRLRVSSLVSPLQ